MTFVLNYTIFRDYYIENIPLHQKSGDERHASLIAFSVGFIAGRPAMLDSLKNRFTQHPHALEETYGQHFGHAMSYSGRLLKASFCAFMHALFPFLFEKTASNEIRAMYAEMTARGATAPVSQETRVLPAE
jgi:hypothetical protein